MPLITLDNISLNFSEKLILNEVSTTILKGDKIALIGRNGEGKSTFMRVLAGAIEPDDGKVKIKNGIKISKMMVLTSFRINFSEKLREILSSVISGIG
jgi:ATP-binding cassette subfamily F protein uup